MRGYWLLALTILLASPVLADFDNSSAACKGGGYDWISMFNDGLIAHWRMDESSGNVASDELGNYDAACTAGYHGIEDWVAGKYGNAIYLDDTMSMETCNTPLIINQSGDYSYTYSLWIKLTNDYFDDDCYIIDTDNGGADWSLILKGGYTYPDYWVGTGSSWYQVNNVRASDTAWQHIAVVFDVDANNIRFYQNGNEHIIDELGFDDSVQNLTFGNSLVNYLQLDDVRVYDHALSANEVQHLYEFGPYYGCCGDDGTSDNFYNGTLNDTSFFCVNGSLINQGIDSNSSVCEAYDYDWFTGGGLFESAVNYPVGDEPNAVGVGDLNNDGFLDLVSADFKGGVGDNLLSVYLGVGDGTFTSSGTLTVDWYPNDVITKDLDGDGDLDVVSSNYGDDTIAVLLGNGDATFDTLFSYTVSYNPRDLNSGDLNNDGVVDVFTTGDANQVSVLLGMGNGSFYDAVNYAVGDSPNAVGVGDLNNDGWLDLITADTNDYNLTVLFNDGDGTFDDTRSVYYVGLYTSPAGLGVGDLNNDGWLDLVSANSNLVANSLTVFLNDGDGTFNDSVTAYSVGSGPQDVAIVELNGDGWLDLVSADRSSNQVSVLFNDGDGTFDDNVFTYPVGSQPFSVSFGDFDGNGGLNPESGVDLVTVNNGADSLSVLLNFGLNGTNSACCGDDATLDNFYNGTLNSTNFFCLNGTFIQQSIDENNTVCNAYGFDYFFNSTSGSNPMCCGDDEVDDDFYNAYYFCGNGTLLIDADSDQALCEEWGKTWFTGTTTGSNDPCCGDDSFESFHNTTLYCYNGNVSPIVDFVKDACEGLGDEYFYHNTSFSEHVIDSSIDGEALDFGDLDGDGDLDLVLTKDGTVSALYYYLFDGTTFGPRQTIDSTIYYYGYDVLVDDFNGDGLDDIALTQSKGGVAIFMNQGGLSFSNTQNIVLLKVADEYYDGPIGLISGDVDGDGDLDLVVGGRSSVPTSTAPSIGWLKNDGSGTFTTEQTFSNYTNFNWVSDMRLGDVDGDNDLDLIAISQSDSKLSWFENVGGYFGERRDIISYWPQVHALEVGDLDGDGDLDVVSNSGAWPSSMNFTYWLGDGAGNFASGVKFANVRVSYEMDLADLDGDGDLDLISNTGYEDDIDYYINNGSIFTDPVRLTSSFTNGIGLRAADLDGDGDFDFVATGAVGPAWFENLGLEGSGGMCCDDVADSFYNDSHFCYQGTIYDDGDAEQAICEAWNGDWFTGTTTGNNDPCCGDDGASDDFYNGSISDTEFFCVDSSLINLPIDESESACVAWGYDWFSGATGDYTQCCGDDGSLDDFGNTTGACCCNGVLIASGTECDLDQDGNVDAMCDNGNLPEIYISDSNYDEAFVESDYSPSFLLKNTGNETICIVSQTISNSSLSYSPDASNEVCVAPGNSHSLKYYFGGFSCSDLDLVQNPVLNITFQRSNGELESIVRYLSFRVRSPLDIASIEPVISDGLPVPLNEAENFLLTLSNKGPEAIDYTASVSGDEELILLFDAGNQRYSKSELERKTFTLRPGSSTIFNIKVVPLSEGERTITLTFNNNGVCPNITDQYSFKVTGFTKATSLFTAIEVSAWDWVMALLLIIIPALILFFKKP